MTKFSRPRSWVDHRLADALEIEGAKYTVELVARRGTGTAGYRVTVVFMPHERAGAEDVEVELAPAMTTTDIHQRVKELTGDPGAGALTALFRGAKGP
jgi:hypothetical protein